MGLQSDDGGAANVGFQPPPYSINEPTAPPVMAQPQYAPVQQPMPVAPQQVIIQQQPAVPSIMYGAPKMHVMSNGWKQDTCGCFDDMSTCCCVMCCTPCMMCKAAGELDETCMILCCVAQPLMALRSKTRHLYKINGSICSDCMATTFCGPCTLCQILAQVKEPCVLNSA